MKFKRCDKCGAEIHTTPDGREIDHEPDCEYYVSPTPDPIDEMVRDFTQVAPRPKSEVRRRITEYCAKLGDDKVKEGYDKRMDDVLALLHREEEITTKTFFKAAPKTNRDLMKIIAAALLLLVLIGLLAWKVANYFGIT